MQKAARLRTSLRRRSHGEKAVSAPGCCAAGETLPGSTIIAKRRLRCESRSSSVRAAKRPFLRPAVACWRTLLESSLAEGGAAAKASPAAFARSKRPLRLPDCRALADAAWKLPCQTGAAVAAMPRSFAAAFFALTNCGGQCAKANRKSVFCAANAQEFCQARKNPLLGVRAGAMLYKPKAASGMT